MWNEQAKYAKQLADIYLDSHNEFVRIVREYESKENNCREDVYGVREQR